MNDNWWDDTVLSQMLNAARGRIKKTRPEIARNIRRWKRHVTTEIVGNWEHLNYPHLPPADCLPAISMVYGLPLDEVKTAYTQVAELRRYRKEAARTPKPRLVAVKNEIYFPAGSTGRRVGARTPRV